MADRLCRRQSAGRARELEWFSPAASCRHRSHRRMREDDMPKKKATRTRRRGSTGQRKANHRKRIHARRSAAKLAQYALTALEAGELKQVREYLEAIRGVAVCADEDVPGWER